jgi:hypothetical protein
VSLCLCVCVCERVLVRTFSGPTDPHSSVQLNNTWTPHKLYALLTKPLSTSHTQHMNEHLMTLHTNTNHQARNFSILPRFPDRCSQGHLQKERFQAMGNCFGAEPVEGRVENPQRNEERRALQAAAAQNRQQQAASRVRHSPA